MWYHCILFGRCVTSVTEEQARMILAWLPKPVSVPCVQLFSLPGKDL